MAVSHRTNRLKLIGTPAVEQLQNGRYQLTVNCTTMNSREDWYSANKARIFPDFGSLESAEMSIDGLAPRTGEAYTDMRLVSVQSSTQQEKYIVTLVYQTLGASFVQVKDDTVNYIENGLRRVTRQSIAKAGTDFQKTVGTTSIASQIDTETAVTCFLANYEVNDTDSYREVTEVYIQAGTLSETEDKVGSQLAIVRETFASTPSTPSGYSIASEQVSNFDGIPTRQFTFLKNGAILFSNTEERQGGTDSTGKVRIQTVEVFNGTPVSSIGGIKISQQESNIGAIVTTRFVFATGIGEVSRVTETRNNGALTITTVDSLGSAGTASGVQIEATTRNQDGYILFRNVFASGIGEISRTTETKNKGALTITTVESLGSASAAPGVEIESTARAQNGYILFRKVFADGVGEIKKTTIPGRITGTKEVTVVSLETDIIPDGDHISKSETQQDGYVQFTNTCIQGTIEEKKTTYKDVVQIEVPGKVECSTIDVKSGEVSGKIAVPKVTPRRKKTIEADVTIEVLSTPPDTIEVAFDLGEISCSVTSTNVSLTRGAGNTVSTTSGTTTQTRTGFTQNFGASARIQTYPGCFLTEKTSEGTISYTTSETPRVDGNLITTDTSKSSRQTKCEGTGSTDKDGYKETGVIKSNVRPILTNLEGTTYYEVITWSVS